MTGGGNGQKYVWVWRTETRNAGLSVDIHNGKDRQTGPVKKKKTDGEQERKGEGTTVHSLHVFILSPPSIFIMLHTHTDTEGRTFDTMQRSFRSSSKKNCVVVKKKSRARANGERVRV